MNSKEISRQIVKNVLKEIHAESEFLMHKVFFYPLC